MKAGVFGPPRAFMAEKVYDYLYPKVNRKEGWSHGVLVLASYAKNVVRLEIRVENFLPMW